MLLSTRIAPAIASRRLCAMKASSESRTEATEAPQGDADAQMKVRFLVFGALRCPKRGLQVVRIEEEGVEAWSGVVQKEGTESRVPDWMYLE